MKRTKTLQKHSFFELIRENIDQMRRLGRLRTAETYTAAFNSFKAFRNNKDINVNDITATVMVEYQAWLSSRALVPNTISFYMRILRAIYNRRSSAGLAWQQSPFRHVYTGVDKTLKRALTLKEIRQIRNLNLTTEPSLDYARDMFMFSFYMRGMSFVDMAYLHKKDLKNGIIYYRRRKTAQMLAIRWEDQMQKILNKYPRNITRFMLPIITDPYCNERSQYRRMQYRINTNLKKIAERICLDKTLTMYVARHSWASIARAKNIPIAIISEGMGHTSDSTTSIYLASLDSSAIDNANAIIIKSI